VSEVVGDEAAVDPLLGHGSNNGQVAHGVSEREGCLGTKNGQSLTEKVRSLGRVQPNGGWRPWACREPLPDWLTVEEPIYVNPT
jgi:hypothetical protein